MGADVINCRLLFSGENRILSIYKPSTNTAVSYDAVLSMSTDSSNLIEKFLLLNKVTDRELSEAQELAKNKKPKKYSYGFSMFKLSVPPRYTKSYEIVATHSKLPITTYRDQITNMITKNQVVVIAGDTGSGKTTQVPQYILDDYAVRREPCRIICTQPRRIAAVSMADRVSYERNEDIGSSGTIHKISFFFLWVSRRGKFKLRWIFSPISLWVMEKVFDLTSLLTLTLNQNFQC